MASQVRRVARHVGRLAVLLFAATMPETALAHASERGHVLLLPTGYYLFGGALAVAASFTGLALLRGPLLARYASARVPLFAAVDHGRFWTSAASFFFLVVLVIAGIAGSRDPLANPLPLVIWTLLWVGITIMQGLVGNIWHWLDPWYAPVKLLARMLPRAVAARQLPEWLGHWPAVITFLGFAWFELVDLAPEDPARLANAVGLYWLATFGFMLVFGHETWGRRGEFLTAFYGMLARGAVIGVDPIEGRRQLSLSWPGARIADAPALSFSGVVFLLAVLASVSFDGLSKTFRWLGSIGINPLEYPGRSAVVLPNTLGLCLSILVLAAIFLLAVHLGTLLAKAERQQAAGLLVWSIVPIALAYHFSHYLTALLVDGQYAMVALSDPFARGWDLLGTAQFHVEAGVVMGHEAAWMIWNAQALAIIGGHVLAVVLAHSIALRLYQSERLAARSQLPLAAVMIAYTVFGLWLLSTPSAG